MTAQTAMPLELCALRNMLSEHISISRPRALGPLSAITFVGSDLLPTVVVNQDLSVSDQVVQVLHCFAHIRLGHYDRPLRIATEPAKASTTGAISESDRALEEQADQLTMDWIRGRNIPGEIRRGIPDDGEGDPLFLKAQRWAHKAHVSKLLANVGLEPFVRERHQKYHEFRQKVCAERLAQLATTQQESPCTKQPSTTPWWSESQSKEGMLNEYRRLADEQSDWNDDETDEPFE